MDFGRLRKARNEGSSLKFCTLHNLCSLVVGQESLWQATSEQDRKMGCAKSSLAKQYRELVQVHHCTGLPTRQW